MQNAGVIDLVRRVLERYRTDERMLDAYWQWASNPTPAAVGYALEENCGFIATNLLTRYGKPAIELVTRLAEECSDLRQEARVHDLRHAIMTVINGEAGALLREGTAARLNEDRPDRRVLRVWLATRLRWCNYLGRDPWLAGEFDWSLGLDLEMGGKDLRTPLGRALAGAEVERIDLLREAMAVGLVNRLFYRDPSGRMEPRTRPGPRIPLQMVDYLQ